MCCRQSRGVRRRRRQRSSRGRVGAREAGWGEGYDLARDAPINREDSRHRVGEGSDRGGGELEEADGSYKSRRLQTLLWWMTSGESKDYGNTEVSRGSQALCCWYPLIYNSTTEMFFWRHRQLLQPPCCIALIYREWLREHRSLRRQPSPVLLISADLQFDGWNVFRRRPQLLQPPGCIVLIYRYREEIGPANPS
jgi:hypothetical protein